MINWTFLNLELIILCVCVTCAQVGVLLQHVLALMDPFSIALEEDLQRGPSLAAQLDGVTLHDVGVHGLLHEAWQRPGLAVLQGGASQAWGGQHQESDGMK